MSKDTKVDLSSHRPVSSYASSSESIAGTGSLDNGTQVTKAPMPRKEKAALALFAIAMLAAAFGAGYVLTNHFAPGLVSMIPHYTVYIAAGTMVGTFAGAVALSKKKKEIEQQVQSK